MAPDQERTSRERLRPDVRRMRAQDWPAVRAIFTAGIATGHATFETEPPSWQTFDESRYADLRLVAEEPSTGDVVGWAAAEPTSARACYAGVAQHGLYVEPACTGRGVGRTLLLALIEASEEHGVWTLQSGIFPENSASLGLHLSCGFRVLGTRERVGRLNGCWRDVVLVERRSHRVGL